MIEQCVFLLWWWTRTTERQSWSMVWRLCSVHEMFLCKSFIRRCRAL